MFRALIIDDEKPARTAISALGAWSVYGIEPPFTATNGKDGLKAMRELQPDIVFIDMEMPVMDGIQFCNRQAGVSGSTVYSRQRI